MGHDQKTASAEMMFYDCVFDKCERGISFLAFNDYDNAIARCIFRDCGSAIHCYRGNVYVRDCHFLNSRLEDLLLSVHSHSVRRCTSSGSNAFIRPSQPGAYAQQVAVQDCVVRGWHDRAGAVQLANCGPVLIFDSAFSGPVDAESPAIALVNGAQWRQTLITANIGCERVRQLIASAVEGNRIENVPRPAKQNLMALAAANRWLARPRLPGSIVDAKVDGGAVGDGRTDDTAAIQKTIDAAAAAGNGTQAYLPAGTYRISRTLRLGPGRYSLAGQIARRTELVWGGEAGGTMIHADNTNGAQLSQLFMSAPKGISATAIQVTADRPGAIDIDGIFAGGSHQPEFYGTRLEGLPAGFVVTSSHLDGEVTIDGCGDAKVLLDYYFAGYAAPMTIRGPTGSGFLGIHSAAASHNAPDLTVMDSASVVIGDFYTEQTMQSLLAEGKPGQPPGRVTISYAKQACREPGVVQLAGYSGQVSVSSANMMYRPGVNAEGQPVKIGEKAAKIGDEAAVLPVAGKDAVLLLLGNSFKTGAPTYELKGGKALQLGGNVWRMDGERSIVASVPDTEDTETLTKAVNVALDHFRELSMVSLQLDLP